MGPITKRNGKEAFLTGQLAVSRRSFLLALTASALSLATGCVSGSSEPPFYRDLSSGSAELDEASALGLINSYRGTAGLQPLQLNEKLTKIARLMAIGLSTTNATTMPARGEELLRTRLAQDGFDAPSAVYNVSAGYRRMSEAFSGWRDSDIHDAHMKSEALSQMGIATAFSGSSKYRVFWALLLAKPV